MVRSCAREAPAANETVASDECASRMHGEAVGKESVRRHAGPSALPRHCANDGRAPPRAQWAVMVTGTLACALCPAESVTDTFRLYCPATGLAHCTFTLKPERENVMPRGTPEIEIER